MLLLYLFVPAPSFSIMFLRNPPSKLATVLLWSHTSIVTYRTIRDHFPLPPQYNECNYYVPFTRANKVRMLSPWMHACSS